MYIPKKRRCQEKALSRESAFLEYTILFRVSVIFPIQHAECRETLGHAPEGGLVGAEECVEVDAACQQGERLCVFSAVDEFIYIVAACELQKSGELSVERMLDDDILYGAAFINHGIELCLHFCSIMAAGDAAAELICGLLSGHQIAAGRRGDIVSGGPEQSDIAHNDLSAHREATSERSGAERPLAFCKQVQDILSSLFCFHGSSFPW